ncbi:MAG: hypothetical protein L3V56_04360 [Candidatus Magnetoovum sp. WYHC-5]|nr:hypothetical protein [Candidatus Magnetoovum sp. WYHC-5]
MKKIIGFHQTSEVPTWVERSGFIDFLSKVPLEVERFNKTFGFDIEYKSTPPKNIDGSTELLIKTGFVMIRNNRIFSQRQYCLYALLEEGVFNGYIGIYNDGNIKTLMKVNSITDFKNVSFGLYDWMKELIRVSCNKL